MLQRVVCENEVVIYRSPLLDAAGVPHAFSTRLGGVSDGVFASLNLGNPNGCPIQDTLNNIAENYSRLQSAIGCAERERVYVHQVHGCNVRTAAKDAPFDIHMKADAIYSDDAQRLPSIRTADCVPVLLANRSGRRVAAIHAGWRGVIAGVVIEALRHFDDAGNVLAAIGPCIGYDAFEVGLEVVDEFDRVFQHDAPTRRLADGKGRVDLKRAIALQLNAHGVTSDRIDTTDRCTFTHADEFFSHRREHGITGRMAAVIGAVA